MTELDSLVEAARASFAQAQTPADLENAKALYLGKSGRITEMMKGMAALSVEEKKTFGAAVNMAKQGIESALTTRRQELADAELAVQLKAEAFDVSLPEDSYEKYELPPYIVVNIIAPGRAKIGWATPTGKFQEPVEPARRDAKKPACWAAESMRICVY